MFELDGKVALVTGSAKGIGRRVSEALAANGATVVLTDIVSDAIDTTIGRRMQHDVTSTDDWATVIRSIEQTEGRLDILVNNAGIILNKPFLETSLDELRNIMAINVESIWIGTQLAAPLMKGSGISSIINLSSIYGQVAGPMQAAYSATKGAVRLLTKATAVEFARAGFGIRVNSIHPGPVDTDLGRSGLEPGVAAGRFANLEVAKAAVASAFPMGRWADVDDIAGAALFLASDASKFVTGTELVVDGGYSII